MEWNCLCDGLTDGFDKVPDQYIQWSYREPLIK